MSNVVVLLGQRRVTIKTQPNKPLNEIRTEACRILQISQPYNYILRHNGAKLDLSRQLRFTRIAPGAKLELIRVSAGPQLISVTLRIIGQDEQLSGNFDSTTCIFSILRRLEHDARVAGSDKTNITQRACLSSNDDTRTAYYEMPSVRVANRELNNFTDLQKTLMELGCQSRQLLVLRFSQTDIPFNKALEQIAHLDRGSLDLHTTKSMMPKESDVTTDHRGPETMNNSNSFINHKATAAQANIMGPSQNPIQLNSRERDGKTNVPSEVSVFHPSSSSKIAAASVEVPESAYDIGIDQLKRIKENYSKEARPQRLPSDKELEEKQKALEDDIHNIMRLIIKVKYPDGYISCQELPGNCSGNDLYERVRRTLRYPNEPFLLRIPPREDVPRTSKRLTSDLKLRSGVSLHLVWDGQASKSARVEPTLREDLIISSKELPLPSDPIEVDEKLRHTEEKKPPNRSKEALEKKFKNLLGLKSK